MNLFNIFHTTIDKPISLYLNSFTDNYFVWNIVYFFADAPIFIIPLFLVIWWFYFHYKKEPENKNKLLFICYATIVAVIINITIQQFIHLERPEENLKNMWKLILNHIPDASFPSDHASVWSAFLMSLFLFWFTKFWYLIIPFILIMLLSRIAGGIHWPWDIFVWMIVWIISSFFIYKSQNVTILKYINKKILQFTSFFKL